MIRVNGQGPAWRGALLPPPLPRSRGATPPGLQPSRLGLQWGGPHHAPCVHGPARLLVCGPDRKSREENHDVWTQLREALPCTLSSLQELPRAQAWEGTHRLAGTQGLQRKRGRLRHTHPRSSSAVGTTTPAAAGGTEEEGEEERGRGQKGWGKGRAEGEREQGGGGKGGGRGGK